MTNQLKATTFTEDVAINGDVTTDLTLDGDLDVGGGNVSSDSGAVTHDDASTFSERVTLGSFLNIGSATLTTIASGVVTADPPFMRLAAESGSTDDLDTINGGSQGDLLWVRPDGSDVITLKDGTGNLVCPGGSDVALNFQRALLLFDAGDWHVLLVQT
jgi:hypothetical protein